MRPSPWALKPTKPLYERAWVVQERILPLRTLEYTSGGIRYHCAGGTFGQKDGFPFADIVSPWNKLLKLDSEKISETDKLGGQHSWMQIVHAYTASAFTHEMDRQVALTGVTTVLHKRTGLKFSHGGCKEFFPYSLFWSMDHARNLTWQAPYPGPSWSSTFRPEPSGFGVYDYPDSGDVNATAQCMIDEGASTVSLRARFSAFQMIKIDPGYPHTPRNDGFRIQDAAGVWTKPKDLLITELVMIFQWIMKAFLPQKLILCCSPMLARVLKSRV